MFYENLKQSHYLCGTIYGKNTHQQKINLIYIIDFLDFASIPKSRYKFAYCWIVLTRLLNIIQHQQKHDYMPVSNFHRLERLNN